MKPSPIYLCGPTASGKSAHALRLAQELDGEIVNADAFQLYRGLEILTAAPAPADFEIVPHHLYGVLDPAETCDAQRYLQLALPVIEEISSRGKTPIVTGGSGLYLKFLTHGPSPLPPGDAATRARLDALSLEELCQQLHSVDPEEAARINLRNRRYVARALEIFLLSGIPASQQRNNWQHVSEEKEQHLQGYLLQVERAMLHHRIALRSAQMLQQGAITEVAKLRSQLSATCLKAIGVPQILAFLDGEIDAQLCEQKIIEATRQYAKRQETWFRRETWLQPIVVE